MVQGQYQRRGDRVTEAEFREALASARAIVESWPEWKKNILEQSGKATVSVPREPVLGECECF